MEYVFKNSPRDEVTKVSLNAFAATVSHGAREEYIPYANITAVRLSRFGRKLFKIHLYQDGLKPIVLTSRNYDEAGRSIDQAEAYQQFVRELHHYLKSKSSANYTSGSSPEKMVIWGVIFMVMAFSISFTVEYLGMGLINAYMQGLVLWILSLAVMAAFSLGSFPRGYHPSNIPVQFLP